MNKFEIEKGIPIPEQGRSSGRHPKYPFAELEIGDCITGEKQMSNAARAWVHRHEVKFAIRKLDKTTYRIWRIA